MSDSIVISHSGVKSTEVRYQNRFICLQRGKERRITTIMQAPFTSTMLRNALPGRSDLEHPQEGMRVKITYYECVLVLVKNL